LDGGAPLVRGGRDVEKHELVGTGRVIAARQFHGIAGVAQIDEPHALDDPARVDVEARDHALVVHHSSSLRASSTACASATAKRLSYSALPTITPPRLT